MKNLHPNKLPGHAALWNSPTLKDSTNHKNIGVVAKLALRDPSFPLVNEAGSGLRITVVHVPGNVGRS